MREQGRTCPYCGSEMRTGVRFCAACGRVQTQTPHNLAAIRALLLAAFTPATLHRFCLDRPRFRPVINSFGPGHGLDLMVDEIIKYCRARLLWNELLDAVEEDNPRQYALFAPSLGSEPAQRRDAGWPGPRPFANVPGSPARPMPRVLTIYAPIALTLVHVPAGEFLMGSDRTKDKHAVDDEEPQRVVYVPDFYIGKYPVTLAQYEVFLKARKKQSLGARFRRGTPRTSKASARTEHPVIGVLWEDAIAFCDWLSQEAALTVHLPSEAEWEKAARGGDGRIYPWGDDWDRTKCNSASVGSILLGGTTSPVGHYSPAGDSPYGVSDMAGNVWEWCQSLYWPYPYQADDGRERLEADGERVVRGGSWSNTKKKARCACRHKREVGAVGKFFVGDDLSKQTGTLGVDSLGFRVVAEPVPPGHRGPWRAGDG